MSNEKQLHAKLVRGSQYVYRAPNSERGTAAIVFEKNRWVPITEELREHLVVHAVDLVTISGGGEAEPSREERQKFEFHRGPIDEDETEVDAKPRSRRRVR